MNELEVRAKLRRLCDAFDRRAGHVAPAVKRGTATAAILAGGFAAAASSVALSGCAEDSRVPGESTISWPGASSSSSGDPGWGGDAGYYGCPCYGVGGGGDWYEGGADGSGGATGAGGEAGSGGAGGPTGQGGGGGNAGSGGAAGQGGESGSAGAAGQGGETGSGGSGEAGGAAGGGGGVIIVPGS